LEWQKLALGFGTAIRQHVMWLKPTVTMTLGIAGNPVCGCPDI
jgi:hypothetical protein